MLLTCPNCKTIFKVEKSLIGKGRKVNCGVCSNQWIATLDSLKEEKPKSFNKQDIEVPTAKDHIKPLKKNERIIINDLKKPLLSKEINRANEFEEKIKKFSRLKLFSQSLQWFFLWLLLFGAIVFALGFFGKNMVAAYFPKSIDIYKVLDIALEPNLDVLETVDVKAEFFEDVINISGKIINKGIFSSVSPTIIILGYSQEGKVIDTFYASGENLTIDSSLSNFFNAQIDITKNESYKNIKEIKTFLREKIIFP